MANPGPASTTTEHPLGGGGNPAYLGVAGGSLGFFQDPFGGGAVPQPSGAAQAVVARGVQVGSIGIINTSQSPAGIVSNGTTEIGVTLISAAAAWKVGTSDLLYVNKPTAQAGLGVGNVRVSGANVAGITFSNFTGAVLTPTAGEKYGFVAIKGFPTITASLTPAPVGPATIGEQLFTVAGLRVGELVQVSKAAQQAGLDIVGCRVAGANSLGITFANVTTATITPTAAQTYTVFELGGLDAVNNEVLANINCGTITALTTATSQEKAITVTGLAATDSIKGVSKPTAQAGLGIVGYRTSGANSLGVTFANMTAATITATASEQYDVAISRPNPVAPMVLYSVALSPAGIGPSTTAEQGFTVTGLISSSLVWVNKPSAQAGLGIVGTRVSGSSNLAITYANLTAATITPTAGETYLIGNFQVPVGDDQSTWVQTASVVQQNTSILSNALRTALSSTGFIAGA